MAQNKWGNDRSMPGGYKAFFPSKLPVKIDISDLYNLLSEADRAIGGLNRCESLIPNFNLITQRFAQKEALLSSQIEGTQSSLIEIFSNKEENIDVREVKNYFNALNHGIKRIKQDDFPLSLRLVKEIHEILMKDVRGGEFSKFPGQFRKSQNWIGGTRPGNAIFVPPPYEEVDDFMGNLEKYFYENDLPDLLKCALIHYQFETIHPFCDGNGRLGRILIVLYFIWKNLLSSPILYLSLYFKTNRDQYYDKLMKPRSGKGMKSWLRFFLEGVVSTSKQVAETTDEILALKERDRQKIIGSVASEIQGANSSYNLQLLDLLFKNPIILITDVEEEFKVSYPTAKIAVSFFENLGILQKISQGNRYKRYIYKEYVDILDKGCENL